MDNFFLWVQHNQLTHSSHEKSSMDMFPSSRELRDGFSRFFDLRLFPRVGMSRSIIYTITLWPMDSIPSRIPFPFLESFSSLLFHLESTTAYTANQQLLHDYFSNCTTSEHLSVDLMNSSIPSFIPCFSQMKFQSDSLCHDSIILVPLTITQQKCLHALYQRWSFFFNSTCVISNGVTVRSSFNKDVMFSVYLEMLRIYTHPFLAGCSASLLLEHSDFLTEFSSASGKVIALNQIIRKLTKVAMKRRINSRPQNVK